MFMHGFADVALMDLWWQRRTMEQLAAALHWLAQAS
jgi:hypothetical protein